MRERVAPRSQSEQGVAGRLIMLMARRYSQAVTSRDAVEADLRRRGYPHFIDVNQLIWTLMHRADQEQVSIKEVEQRVEDRSVFAWLNERFGIPRPHYDEPLFVDYLQRAVSVEQYGIERNGLLLLIAQCAEALQQELGHYRDALR